MGPSERGRCGSAPLRAAEGERGLRWRFECGGGRVVASSPRRFGSTRRSNAAGVGGPVGPSAPRGRGVTRRGSSESAGGRLRGAELAGQTWVRSPSRGWGRTRAAVALRVRGWSRGRFVPAALRGDAAVGLGAEELPRIGVTPAVGRRGGELRLRASRVVVRCRLGAGGRTEWLRAPARGLGSSLGLGPTLPFRLALELGRPGCSLTQGLAVGLALELGRPGCSLTQGLALGLALELGLLARAWAARSSLGLRLRLGSASARAWARARAHVRPRARARLRLGLGLRLRSRCCSWASRFPLELRPTPPTSPSPTRLRLPPLHPAAWTATTSR